MAAPQRTTRQPPVSTAKTASSPPAFSWLLFAVKVLLVLIILFMLPKLVLGKNHRVKLFDQTLRAMRQNCTDQDCAHYVPEEGLNCVGACMSDDCYQRIYAASPLEDGEIDIVRGIEFENCVKHELKLERQRQRAIKADEAASAI